MNNTLLPQHGTTAQEKRLATTFAEIQAIPIPINLLWDYARYPLPVTRYPLPCALAAVVGVVGLG